MGKGPPHMRVLICVGSMNTLTGGPPKVVSGHALELAKSGHSVEILTLDDCKADRSDCADWDRLQTAGVLVHFAQQNAPRALGCSIQADIFAHKNVRRFDIVHIHGVWTHFCARTSCVARKAKVPYLVSPHGMLDRWSLQKARVKKFVSRFFLGTEAMLRGAAALQYGTTSEAEQARDLKLPGRSVIIPNGFDPSAFVRQPGKENSDLLRTFPELKDAFPVVLFFSRMHPKKGLDLLLESFARASSRFPQARLLIAAIPQDDAYLRFVRDRAAQPDLARKCFVTTDYVGAHGRTAINTADIYTLPSYQEGFSMSLVEALAYGLPSVISDRCHMDVLQGEGAAYVVPPTVDAFEEAFLRIFSLSPAELARMGDLGRKFATDRYSWARIVADLAAVYRDSVGVQ